MDSGTPTTGPSTPLVRRLWFQTFAAMAVGVVVTLLTHGAAAHWLGWMGVIFVRLLKMVIVPLIVTSIVTGVASVGSGRQLGRLGAKTLVYYVCTSLLAILTGLVLVNLIRPGVGADLAGQSGSAMPEIQTPGSLADIFVRMIPTNPIQAMADGDMLAIIFFAILLGVGLAHLPERQKDTVGRLFDQGFDLMMMVTGGIIRLVPLGVLGLISQAVASSGVKTFQALGLYALTIVAGLSIHWLVTLPLLLLLLGRISPWIHYRNMSEAFITAFSTSSSSATLPVTIRNVRQRVGVSNSVTSFVLPMGATINMDGTALYECVGAIFIAQVLGFHLDFSAQLVVVITALLASIGAAGIPSAGLVMIFLVTESVGLRGPEVATVIGIMLAVDRPLDMYRTMVNVTSDSAGAAIIARSEGEVGINAH
ncbi:MAG: dicarboxylate/amino acid:cation symporter [Candidatus Eisenbacteria bacterium]|uniref:Dicarboxylate/amino acid:cation symporter n=1 Tax=Eiseniibacteriota bacterium TaxID=2212470 RepID=A0A956M0Y4_UNCEI|nr:dicarboxylate/amino acid:cation symporter [Candidatus Eisenbacteria bacterium]